MLQKGFSIAGLIRGSSKIEAQGRLGSRVPISIIDIGSNSVRQVVYEGLSRSPSILFNEKVLCGLGRGVAKDGLLDDDATQRAMSAIQRFVSLSSQLGVGEIHVLATAATREAKNGNEFISKIEELTGKKIELLSGRMEAEYAALGVKAGFYQPNGIAADLGGGSVELIAVNGETSNGVTMPLGSLRLQEMSKDDLEVARKIARNTVKGTNVYWPGDTRTLYAIGGTWRSLARLHMLEFGHPGEVIHSYTIGAKEFISFCRKVSTTPLNGFEKIDEISKNRKPLLPFGAVVMAEILEHIEAEKVEMSAVGVREGYLYSLLDIEVQKQDALLEASAELSILRARSPGHSQELAVWTDKAFDAIGIEETDNQRRWRLAACNLADIAWRSASDFRSEQTLGIINNAGFNSISYEGRAYLALVTFHRYQGLGAKKTPPQVASLATLESTRLARILAALFRIGYLFSAAVEGVLPNLEFKRDMNGQLKLNVPKHLSGMVGEKPVSRIDNLSRELSEKVSVEIVGQ